MLYLLFQMSVVPNDHHPVAQVAQVAADAVVFGLDIRLVVGAAVAEDTGAGLFVVEVRTGRVVGQ